MRCSRKESHRAANSNTERELAAFDFWELAVLFRAEQSE